MSTQIVNTIEHELIEASGFVPEKRYRKRQDYLTALLRVVCDLPDQEFEKLSDEAAEWAYQAGDAYQIKGTLPDFGETKPNGADHPLEVEASDNTDQEAWETDPPAESSPTLTLDGDEYEDLGEDEQGSSSTNQSPVIQIAMFEDAEDAAPEVVEKPKAKRGRKPGTKVVKKAKDLSIDTKSSGKPRKQSNGHLRPPTAESEWGVIKGSVSEVVCQLMARPEGTTMREIADITGHYRYNVVNRLRRTGWHITKDGPTLRLHGRVDE
jgi:hypothetical protein